MKSKRPKLSILEIEALLCAAHERIRQSANDDDEEEIAICEELKTAIKKLHKMSDELEAA